MSYVLPTFNVNFKHWIAYDPATTNYGSGYVTGQLNMTPGRRTLIPKEFVPAYGITQFLLPALYDVRPSINGGDADLFECPKGSKLFWAVLGVLDIGKGFANEHRMAIVRMKAEDTTFADVGVVPFPLPIP